MEAALKSPMALFRLMRRPFLLFAVVIWVSVCVMWPLSELSDAGLPMQAIWDGPMTPRALRSLWYVVLFLPLSIGLLAGGCRIELQRTSLSWMLPGVRRGLLAGALALAIPLAGVHALITSRHAPGDAAFAAFSLALFWFLVPGYWLDPAARATKRWLAVALTANVLLFVQYRAVMSVPLLTGLLVVPLSVEMLSAIASPVAARRRAAQVQRSGFANGPPSWLRLFGRPGANARRPRLIDLATQRVWPWLRATAHEAVHRYPVPHLVLAFFAVLWARWFNEPLTIVLVGLLCLTNPHLQLRRNFLYPLSRTERARLAYVGAMSDALTFAALTGLLLLVTPWLRLGPLGIASPDPVSPLAWMLAPVVIALFAPLAQWYAVRFPAWRNSSDRSPLRTAIPATLLYTLFAGGSIQLIASPDRSQEALLYIVSITATLGLATQLVHWLALHRHFATADLAGSR